MELAIGEHVHGVIVPGRLQPEGFHFFLKQLLGITGIPNNCSLTG